MAPAALSTTTTDDFPRVTCGGTNVSSVAQLVALRIRRYAFNVAT